MRLLCIKGQRKQQRSLETSLLPPSFELYRTSTGLGKLQTHTGRVTSRHLPMRPHHLFPAHWKSGVFVSGISQRLRGLMMLRVALLAIVAIASFTAPTPILMMAPSRAQTGSLQSCIGHPKLGVLTNSCSYDIEITFCYDDPNPSSFATGLDCRKQSFGAATVKARSWAGITSSGKGRLNIAACKAPAFPVDPHWDGATVRARACYGSEAWRRQNASNPAAGQAGTNQGNNSPVKKKTTGSLAASKSTRNGADVRGQTMSSSASATPGDASSCLTFHPPGSVRNGCGYSVMFWYFSENSFGEAANHYTSIQANGEEDIQISAQSLSGGNWWACRADNPACRAAFDAIQQAVERGYASNSALSYTAAQRMARDLGLRLRSE